MQDHQKGIKILSSDVAGGLVVWPEENDTKCTYGVMLVNPAKEVEISSDKAGRNMNVAQNKPWL